MGGTAPAGSTAAYVADSVYVSTTYCTLHNRDQQLGAGRRQTGGERQLCARGDGETGRIPRHIACLVVNDASQYTTRVQQRVPCGHSEAVGEYECGEHQPQHKQVL